eukprot:TRINITY_DN52824_c0_g1_i1.p1 TRINITY_DN52824_c0_g1~~TRINITY_DN52824_c0_g1_i1.p1  ORF type:complete len:213 (+),score=37.12 TRINITY_DN52824_c0_g1_i1:37-639(+)
MLSFAIAWGGVPWVYPSEIFPMKVKEKALASSVCSQWSANFVIAYVIPQQVEVMKVTGTFLFYSICLGLAFLLVYEMVPETAGVTLEGMENLFSGKLRVDDGIRMTEDADLRKRLLSVSSACSLDSLDDLFSMKARMTRAQTHDDFLSLSNGLLSHVDLQDAAFRRTASVDPPSVRARRGGAAAGSKVLRMGPHGTVALV